MTHPVPIIIGYTSEIMPGAEHNLAAPQPPKNYGAEAAERWRQDPEKGGEALANMFHAAGFAKVVGNLTRIYAADPLRKAVFSSDNSDNDPAVAFAMWLLDGYPTAFGSYAGSSERNAVAFYGFDPKPFVRMLGTQCHACGFSVPLRLWYGNQDCFDPYDMLVSSDFRKFFPVVNLLASIGLSVPRGWSPHKSPKADAAYAAELISAYELFPTEFGASQLRATIADSLQPISELEDLEGGEDSGDEPEEVEVEAEEEVAVETELEEEVVETPPPATRSRSRATRRK